MKRKLTFLVVLCSAGILSAGMSVSYADAIDPNLVTSLGHGWGWGGW